MKKFLNNTIILGSILAIATIAGVANAGPQAIKPPCPLPITQDCVTRTNTAWPINATSNDQAKMGSMSVSTANGDKIGDFFAEGIARFKSKLYVGGPVLGESTDIVNNPEESTLQIGGGVIANFLANGSIYVKGGGLYSDKVRAPSGTLKEVCADQGGNIVFCPEPPTCATDPTLCPPREMKRYYSVANNIGTKTTIDGRYGVLTSSTNKITDIVSLDTRKVLINQIPGFTTTTINHHMDNNGQGMKTDNSTLDSFARIWTVAQNGTYDIKYTANGIIDTYIKTKSHQFLETNFYLRFVKPNGQVTTIPLEEPRSGGCVAAKHAPGRDHIDEPQKNLDTTQFITRHPCPYGGTDQNDYDWGGRKHTERVNFSVDFSRSMTLEAGTKVYLYATSVGFGEKPSGLGTYRRPANSDMNVHFYLSTSALDVTQR